MATFRYVGDEPRQVSILPAGQLRRLEPDQVFDVPDDVADSYECQPHYYERQDEPKAPRKTAAAKKGD